MKTKRKLFRCLKTSLLALTLALPLSGRAQFNYYVNNGAATITEYTGPGGAVTIPGTLGGFPVKEIGSFAFNNTPYVNYSLTSVTFPNSVTDIDDHAFEYCSGLTSITFGTGLVSLGQDAFINCTSLPSVSLPASATNLGPGVFGSCNSLTNISLPPTLPRISPALLGQCSSLVTVTIPSSVTSIDEDAFSGCYSLTNIVLPAGVTNIDVRAFQFCESLTNVTIPNSVTSIGDSAFNGCHALPSVTIPASVTNLGNQVFWFCTSLTNISVNGLNPTYSSVDGALFNKAVTTLIQYPIGRAGGYAVPMSVTNIPEYGFYFCPYLTSVTIPSGVTIIRASTFEYSSGLTNVVMPNSVTSIGFAAFNGCSVLSSVTIPGSVSSIGDLVFISCSSLTSVTIPGSVTNIGVGAFEYCSALQQAYFLGNAPTVHGMDGSTDNSVFAGETGTAYYAPGTTGWSATYGSWPTAVGTYQRQPQILGSGQGFGVSSNKINFSITWAPNASVVVEASTNLFNWAAINTNQLVSGTNAFADANWANYPRRFYRVRAF